MKKIKLLMPMATIASTIAVIAPLASCSKTVVEEGIKVTLAPESADEIKIKETKCELNKDSTITLDVPLYKGAKITYILVGTTRLETSAYTFDGETITIKATAMTSKNIEVFVSASNVVGLKAKVEKTYEALQTFKAEDLKVYPVYDDETVTTKALVWNEGYKIYDSEEAEVDDFATTGYTFNRDEAREGSVEFGIEFIPYTRYTTTVKVSVAPRMEPESINVITCASVFKGDKILAKDLIVKASMTDKTNRILEYGKDYLVYDGEQPIENFDTEGYSFTSEGFKDLTIKTIENPDEALETIRYAVNPINLKNALCVTNYGKDATITFAQTGTSVDTKLEYSTNKGKDWTTVSVNTAIPLDAKQSLVFKGDNIAGFSSSSTKNTIKIVSNDATKGNEAKVSLNGSILGLINNNDSSKNPETLPNSCFASLFEGSNAICSTSKNLIGDLKISDQCYVAMFKSCTNLVTAPELPAKSVQFASYSQMFCECSSLMNAPELPATTLGNLCYGNMFYNCSSLETAPNLPAEELASQCYVGMYVGCSNLKNVPPLPAKKLKSYCYNGMFNSCTSLVTAPEILAETIDDQSCAKMFFGCTSLVTVPTFNIVSTYNRCCESMFEGCTSLVSVPALKPSKLSSKCYFKMFKNCTSLTTIPDLTSVTTLAQACCSNMFYGCETLTSICKLVSPTSQYTNQYCYESMFEGCKNLEISTEGDEDHLIFVRPDPMNTQKMFYGTKGEIGKSQYLQQLSTYYWVEQE